MAFASQDDQAMASQSANTMWNSLKGRPVLVLHFIISDMPELFVQKRRLLIY